MSITLTDVNIQHLQEQVAGRILRPDDTDYEQTRLTWNRSTHPYPAIILVAENTDDIIAGVRFAADIGLGVAVQATGHGTQRPANEALLIVTSQMTDVEVDPVAQTATVKAGAIWQHVIEQSVPYGLAPLLGSSPHVGVVSYSLGGGIGWLARPYGLAADSVRSIDVVTADGTLHHTSLTENSDLFWGLRGGGGNFGVVTSMTFDLYPVPSLYGGSLVYPGPIASEALRFFREWIQVLPDQLTSSIAVFKYPSLPQMPEAMRGKVEVILRAAYVGDPVEGKKFIQPWLDWQKPLRNTFEVMPFSQIAAISNDPVDPVSGFGSNELLNELSDEVIELIVQHMTAETSPLTVTELRHAGGAIKRVDSGVNAIGYRDAQLFMQMSGLTPTLEGYQAVKAYIRDYREDLSPYVNGGVYLNFTKSGEEANRTQQAYSPEKYTRLLALKAKYDPNNLFRFSYPLV